MIICRESTAISPVKTFVLLCIRDKVRSQSWDSFYLDTHEWYLRGSGVVILILGNELIERCSSAAEPGLGFEPPEHCSSAIDGPDPRYTSGGYCPTLAISTEIETDAGRQNYYFAPSYMPPSRLPADLEDGDRLKGIGEGWRTEMRRS